VEAREKAQNKRAKDPDAHEEHLAEAREKA
jgi:hypothetical protein